MQCLGKFLAVQAWGRGCRGCHWHVVGRGQGYCQTFYNAQDSLPQHRITQPETSVVLWLRNSLRDWGPFKLAGTPDHGVCWPSHRGVTWIWFLAFGSIGRQCHCHLLRSPLNTLTSHIPVSAFWLPSTHTHIRACFSPCGI